MSRRSFLKVLPTIPFYRVAWSQKSPQLNQLAQQAEGDERPNILFVVFDTLSARHVSLYGYDRNTTPNFARFAERGTVFHNHHTTANFTSPATSSILTGVHPWSHRAFHLHGTVRRFYEDNNIFKLLPDDYYKVAYTHNLLVTSLLHQFGGEIDLLKETRELCLADNEFADVLFNNDFSAAFWGESTALRDGATPPGTLFLSLLDRVRRFSTKRTMEQQYGDLYPRGVPSLHNLFFLLEDAIDWMQQQIVSLPQPFLGYFHLLPPHEPYTTRADFVDRFDDGWQPVAKEPHFASEGHKQGFLNNQRREYDEYLAFTDAEFGRLMDNLEQSGALDNTYVVLTSDHGEMFERGIRGHVTITLFEQLLHVPLIIRKPGQTQREDVMARTSSVDLLPTMLHLTGQPLPDWLEGRVLPSFSDAAPDPQRAVFGMEAKSNPKEGPLRKATLAVVQGDHKLIHYRGYHPEEPDGRFELFNLADDPEELENLYAPDNPVAQQLLAEINAQLPQTGTP